MTHTGSFCLAMPRTATFPPNRISQVLNLNSGGERACNWFHSTGWDGHFCPNVFPLGISSGPYDRPTLGAVLNILNRGWIHTIRTESVGLRSGDGLCRSFRPPSEITLLHTVTILQIVQGRGVISTRRDRRAGWPSVRCRRIPRPPVENVVDLAQQGIAQNWHCECYGIQ